MIGGGPIGMEMAQAHRRLGADVTVLQKGAILPKDDPDLVSVVRNRLTAEGVDLRENVKIARVERHGNGIAAVLSDGSPDRRIGPAGRGRPPSQCRRPRP